MQAPEIEEMPAPEWLEPLAPAASWIMVEAWAVVIPILILVWIHRSRNLPQRWDDEWPR